MLISALSRCACVCVCVHVWVQVWVQVCRYECRCGERCECMCARQRTTLGNQLSFHLVSQGLSCFCCCAAYARPDGWQASRQLCVYLPLAIDIVHVGYRGGTRGQAFLAIVLPAEPSSQSSLWHFLRAERADKTSICSWSSLRSRLAYPVQYDRLTCTPPIRHPHQNLRDLTWGVGSLHCRSELVWKVRGALKLQLTTKRSLK